MAEKYNLFWDTRTKFGLNTLGPAASEKPVTHPVVVLIQGRSQDFVQGRRVGRLQLYYWGDTLIQLLKNSYYVQLYY